MDRIAAAISGINQSTAEMVSASKALASHAADLAAAIRSRETLLIMMSQRYPDARVEEIIAACDAAEQNNSRSG